MPSPRELMTFARAAEQAGYTKSERRKIAENPTEALKEGAHPLFQERFTPGMITAFLSKLESEKGDSRHLVRLGKILAELTDEQLRPADCRLASLAVQYVERALYDGSLLGLKGFDAAAMTYVINRLAKLAQNNLAISEFDPVRLEQFVDAVSAHEEQYFVRRYGLNVGEERELVVLQQKFESGYTTTSQEERLRYLSEKKRQLMEADGLAGSEAHHLFLWSRDHLWDKLQTVRGADLYLVKSILTVKDQNAKLAAASGGKTEFRPLEELPQDKFGDHNFLPERDYPPDRRPFFLVHTDTDDYPFCRFAVEYLNQRRSRVIQQRKEKEAKQKPIL